MRRPGQPKHAKLVYKLLTKKSRDRSCTAALSKCFFALELSNASSQVVCEVCSHGVASEFSNVSAQVVCKVCSHGVASKFSNVSAQVICEVPPTYSCTCTASPDLFCQFAALWMKTAQ